MLEWELGEAFGEGVSQFSLVEQHPSPELRRGRSPFRPLHGRRVVQGTSADVIGMSASSLYAVSPAFVAAAAGLTGIAFMELVLEDGPDGYALLGVTGVCGRTNYGRGEVVGRLGEKFLRLRGLHVDQPAPGTDFAMPIDRESILLSSKAANQLAGARLSNLKLERMADRVYDIPADFLGRARDAADGADEDTSRDIARR